MQTISSYKLNMRNMLQIDNCWTPREYPMPLISEKAIVSIKSIKVTKAHETLGCLSFEPDKCWYI